MAKKHRDGPAANRAVLQKVEMPTNNNPTSSNPEPPPSASTTGPSYLDAATSDEATIRHWWTSNPDFNIGIALEGSRLVVVNVDGPEGHKTLDMLIADNGGDFPPTTTVTTGRPGGVHYYFKVPDGHHVPKSCQLGPELDLLAAGKYVVAPPSIHPSGKQYEWVDGCGLEELQDAPDWLLSPGPLNDSKSGHG